MEDYPEIIQRGKDKWYMISLICGITEFIKMKTRAWDWGKRGEVGQTVQTSSSKENKLCGSNVLYSGYS